MIYPLQCLRLCMRSRGSLRDRVTIGVFHTLARFPEAQGQLKFVCDRVFGYERRLIEYK